MHLLTLLSLLILALSKETSSASYSYVTCGSVVKLLNSNFNFRLHSQDAKYGSGSRQQSVTGTDIQEDVHSHWIVKGTKEAPCTRGEPIKCNENIRLQHITTKKNLHSHHFTSPLSGNQEVSGFGNEGEGDSGDNWTVVCSSDFWNRFSTVRFKHVDTGAWLSLSGHTYGRPIPGQMEACAITYSDSTCYWKTAEGVYIQPSELPKINSHQHNEL